MSRFLATWWLDVQIQIRNLFYLVTGAGAGIITLVIVYLIPEERYSLAIPNVVFLGMAMPFYLAAGQILFEKSERTLDALSVSPLRIRDYLISKVVTLGQIGVMEACLITGVIYGVPDTPILFLVGVLQLTTVFVLGGIILVVRYESVNDFLIPSIPVILVLQIMLVYEFGLLEGWVILWPVYGGWMLLLAGMNDWHWESLLLYLCSSLAWIGVFWYWAERAFEKWVLRNGVART